MILHLARTTSTPDLGSRLKLHRPSSESAGALRWLINGHPATLTLWTAEEYAGMEPRPEDARQYSDGTWCALRMD
jgi:hypothetical protein